MSNFIKCWGESFSNFFKADGWFFFLLIILNLPIFFQPFVYVSETLPFKKVLSDEIQNFYSSAVGILIFSVAIHFLLSKLPRVKFFLQILIVIISAVFFVTDIFLLYKFNHVLERFMIQLVLGTNPATVKEFFQNYVLNLPVIIGAAAVIFLIVTAVKKFRAGLKNLSENNLRRMSYYTLIILLPAVLYSAYWMGNVIFILAQNSFNSTILGRNIDNTRGAMKDMGSESEIFAEMDSQNEKIISNNSKIPHVVFVLGESARRDHMQLYGYKLENNPLLTERFKRGELFKFNDVIACANHTAEAMELIFTFSEKDSAEKWYTKPNIFDILRRAGYHTFWISNQTPTSIWGNMDKVFSARCDNVFFEALNQKDSFTRNVDGVLLPPLDNFISNAAEKNFYVVHLYGSHPVYNLRYPPEFAKFTGNNFEEKITAEFDNSILYTDYILEEIIKRFENKNALIIYISDHGQEIFEDGRNFMGHSDETAENLGMIEIPMLIWTSKKFRELYPEKISAISAAKNFPYRTDLIPHTILDLMDIQTESFNPAKSIVNEKFDASFERIYNGKLYTKN